MKYICLSIAYPYILQKDTSFPTKPKIQVRVQNIKHLTCINQILRFSITPYETIKKLLIKINWQ